MSASDGQDASSLIPAARLYREVRYEYSAEFPRILQHLNASLLISTYQAGKLAAVGVRQDALTFRFCNFERAMGVSVSPRWIAVGARRQIHFLAASHELAASVEGSAGHDACWLPRLAHHTGNIHIHELGWGGDGLWLVNTLFSCLCTLHDEFSFVPRWRPPFISELAAEDRCHLNGLAMDQGQPKYVTLLAESNEPAGWRSDKASTGCLLDVESGHTVARGLAMPHSPRVYQGRVYLLDSGNGRLVTIDPADGRIEVVEQVPGYTRGLAFAGQFAFVGLSRIRETAIFGDLPLDEQRSELRCGVAAIDLSSGRAIGWLQFHAGVDEIFSVEVLAGCRQPFLAGPSPVDDGSQDIWVAPPAGQVPPPRASYPPGSGKPHHEPQSGPLP